MPSSAIEEFVRDNRVLTDKEWLVAIEERMQLFVDRKKKLLFRTLGSLRCLLNERGDEADHTPFDDKPEVQVNRGSRPGPNLMTRGFYWCGERVWDPLVGPDQHLDFGYIPVWGFTDQGHWVVGKIRFVRERSRYERALKCTFARVELRDLPVLQRPDLSLRDAALHVLKQMQHEADRLAQGRSRWHPARTLFESIRETDKNIQFIEFGR